jgi:hypothetical protein
LFALFTLSALLLLGQLSGEFAAMRKVGCHIGAEGGCHVFLEMEIALHSSFDERQKAELFTFAKSPDPIGIAAHP